MAAHFYLIKQVSVHERRTYLNYSLTSDTQVWILSFETVAAIGEQVDPSRGQYATERRGSAASC